MKSMNVYIEVGQKGELPLYASLGSSGCDLFAGEDIVIRPGERKIIPVDFRMAIPEGFEAQVRPRSGLSLRTTLRLSNTPGTIDSDYRDVIGVIAENHFTNENLIQMLKEDPALWDEIINNYTSIPLSQYLNIPGYPKGEILVDESGYPFGTIFIKRKQRVAQMIFAEYTRANFIPCGDVGEMGRNRGGGFGHSGL